MVCSGFSIHCGGGLLGGSAAKEVFDFFCHDAITCMLFVVVNLCNPARHRGNSHETGKVSNEWCICSFGGVGSGKSVIGPGKIRCSECIVKQHEVLWLWSHVLECKCSQENDVEFSFLVSLVSCCAVEVKIFESVAWYFLIWVVQLCKWLFLWPV